MGADYLQTKLRKSTSCVCDIENYIQSVCEFEHIVSKQVGEITDGHEKWFNCTEHV